MPKASKNAGEQVRRRGFSIQQKLLALIVLLVAGVVALLALYLPARQIGAMRQSLQTKATSYARLASRQLEPAVAFDDRETAREVFEALAQDSDVSSLSLLNARGDVLAARGSLPSDFALPVTTAREPQLLRGGTSITAVARVISLEGPQGTVVVELSLQRLAREEQSVLESALLAGLLALVLGIGGASFIARSLSRRLHGIARVADAVTAGNLDQAPLEADTSRDEISTVAVAFNTMLAKIRALIVEIQQAAREEQQRLEQLVQERTAALHERNADLTLILDNVGQGFLTLDLRGRMSHERSAVLARWFGAAPESGLFAALLTRVDPDLGTWFELSWEGLAEGVLPLEMCLDQLPKRISHGDARFELDYKPILRPDGELDRVLVVVSDVTARLLRDQAEADEREMTKLFVRASSDRAGLLEFIVETNAQVECIAAGVTASDDGRLKRALHTLKGNSAVYGVETLSALCNRLEDCLAEEGKLEPSTVLELRARWAALSGKLEPLLARPLAGVEIVEADLQAIVAALEAGAPRSEAVTALLRLRLEPTQLRLSRLAEQAIALGKRVGKAVEVQTEASNVRLKADEWSSFWSASIHLLRNSVDHGIESVEERRALGKPETGRLELRTKLGRERFSIEFADDGRGIDWSAVKAQAGRLGLAASSHQDLVTALFAEGLSTRQEASELSGRGVGLGAIKQACRELGGDIEIESALGVGTTFRFVWPAKVVARHLVPPAGSSARAAQPTAPPAFEDVHS
jgi:two-component system chemotaxis sensor kinase CheA